MYWLRNKSKKARVVIALVPVLRYWSPRAMRKFLS